VADNINIDLKKTGWGGGSVDWIQLVENTVKKLQVPWSTNKVLAIKSAHCVTFGVLVTSPACIVSNYKLQVLQLTSM
jgi:hypothetical protein